MINNSAGTKLHERKNGGQKTRKGQYRINSSFKMIARTCSGHAPYRAELFIPLSRLHLIDNRPIFRRRDRLSFSFGRLDP